MSKSSDGQAGYASSEQGRSLHERAPLSPQLGPQEFLTCDAEEERKITSGSLHRAGMAVVRKVCRETECAWRAPSRRERQCSGRLRTYAEKRRVKFVNHHRVRMLPEHAVVWCW